MILVKKDILSKNRFNKLVFKYNDFIKLDNIEFINGFMYCIMKEAFSSFDFNQSSKKL